MSSGIDTVPACAFAPSRDVLEDVIASIERAGARSGSAVDAAQRRAAFAAYEALPVPGPRPGRGWRHDYAKLAYDDLRWTSDRTTVATSPLGAQTPAAPTAGGLFHLGATLLEPAVPPAGDPRVVVTSLADAVRANAPHAHVGPLDAQDRFGALAIAFQNCGAYVHVPDGVVVEEPIQLVFANVEPNAEAVFPHLVVVMGAGARATILERHVGEGQPFVCGIVFAHVGAGAELDYAAIQNAGEEARVIMHRSATSERDARVRWHVADLGGTLVRSVVDAHLDAAGANAQTAALFFNTGFQHVDLATTTDHAVGQTGSETVVRSAATDRGQGRYIGNIVIHPKAHGSEASLRDDALLLSTRAHIDSVPALEIAANDVKAFHGATVGSLDQDALFYAGSRGIARADAVRMVALAFFEPAIARFPGEPLRDEIRSALDHKLDAATEIDA